MRQIREALDGPARARTPTSSSRWPRCGWSLDGDRLLAQSDRVRFDPRTGQMVLDLDTPGLEAAAAATLVTGLVRPLAPPVEQAETWFERASEWDGDPAQWDDAIDAYRRVVVDRSHLRGGLEQPGAAAAPHGPVRRGARTPT